MNFELIKLLICLAFAYGCRVSGEFKTKKITFQRKIQWKQAKLYALQKSKCLNGNKWLFFNEILIRAFSFARSKSHLMLFVGIDPTYIGKGSFSLWIHDHNEIYYDRQRQIQMRAFEMASNHGIKFRSSVLDKLYSRLTSFSRLHLMRLIVLLYFSIMISRIIQVLF